MKFWLACVTIAQILWAGEEINLAPKVVAIDWTAAEILSSLGYEPTAIGDKKNYTVWVGESKMSDKVVDLGMRGSPNLEQLAKIKPDIVIVPSFFSFNRRAIAQSARVVVIDAYKDGELYENLATATREIAALIGARQRAEEFLAKDNEIFANLRERAKSLNARPIAVVQFMDSKHLRIYGANSIYGTALRRLGLKNAIGDEFALNLWGIATIPLTSLFTLPNDTRLVIIEPNPVNIERELKFNTLYGALNLLNDRVQLQPVWGAGAFLSMQRFARELVGRLSGESVNLDANLSNAGKNLASSRGE